MSATMSPGTKLGKVFCLTPRLSNKMKDTSTSTQCFFSKSVIMVAGDVLPAQDVRYRCDEYAMSRSSEDMPLSKASWDNRRCIIFTHDVSTIGFR